MGDPIRSIETRSATRCNSSTKWSWSATMRPRQKNRETLRDERRERIPDGPRRGCLHASKNAARCSTKRSDAGERAAASSSPARTARWSRFPSLCDAADAERGGSGASYHFSRSFRPTPRNASISCALARRRRWQPSDSTVRLYRPEAHLHSDRDYVPEICATLLTGTKWHDRER